MRNMLHHQGLGGSTLPLYIINGCDLANSKYTLKLILRMPVFDMYD